MTALPDAATLHVLHDAQIRRFGGAPGLRDADLLASAVGRVRTAAGYVEMDAIEAASMLCHAILKNHAFVDGNKRTAYGALAMTLAGAGWRIVAPDDEIVEMILAAAGSNAGHERIADWVRARVAPDDTYRLLQASDGGPVRDPFAEPPTEPTCPAAPG